LRLSNACGLILLIRTWAALGLSYGIYVGWLVRGVLLPAPVIDLGADLAESMKSCA